MYEQQPETADVTDWRINFEKPLIVSEFGGDAKAGLHGDDDDRWTEEYQANIYRHQLGMLNRIAQLGGMSRGFSWISGRLTGRWWVYRMSSIARG